MNCATTSPQRCPLSGPQQTIYVEDTQTFSFTTARTIEEGVGDALLYTALFVPEPQQAQSSGAKRPPTTTASAPTLLMDRRIVVDTPCTYAATAIHKQAATQA
ncbi:hypothetical protein Pelo_19402 [Pelomyxa schiedti]|nr:hypothetical protein Pelo_19402 [Pelomyxa schiedti]